MALNSLYMQIMPLAFAASFDEDKDVASLWKDVWSDESSSEAASLRLYIDEIQSILLKGPYSLFHQKPAVEISLPSWQNCSAICIHHPEIARQSCYRFHAKCIEKLRSSLSQKQLHDILSFSDRVGVLAASTASQGQR